MSGSFNGLPVIGGPACGLRWRVGNTGTVRYVDDRGRIHTYYRMKTVLGGVCLLHSGTRMNKGEVIREDGT